MTNATPRPVAPAPIAYETAEHVLCDASTPGAIPFIAGGLQPDGTYLSKLDLDGHHDDQDPDRLLAYLKQHKPDLFARLVIRRSAGLDGHRPGYHLPIRTTRPLATVKIYDPWGIYAGEICDGRIELDTCGYDDIPLLSDDELRQLLYYIHAPGAMGEKRAEGSAAAIDSLRKERIAEGLKLIAGWKSIRSWRARLGQLCDERPQLAKRRAELRTKTDRSAAYSLFVQSLMLHAIPLGTSTAERCQVVAAMAIGTGANGKEDDGDYRIERDTAALIAKIIHGDRFETPNKDGTYARWTIPAWAKGQQLPKVEPTPAPEPHKPTNRATQRRDLRLAALRRKLSAIEPDELGRRRFLIERISPAPRRTAQADLKWLRDQGEIVTGQIDGNGQPYAILTAQFGGAKSCKKPDTASINPADLWGASAEPTQRAPMPDTADQTAYAIEEEEAPKISAPPSEPAGSDPRARKLLGAPLPAPAGAPPTTDDEIRRLIAEHFAREAAKPRPRSAHEGQQTFMGRPRRQEVKVAYPRKQHGGLPAPSPYRPPKPLPVVDLPEIVSPAPVVDQGEAMRQSLLGALRALHGSA